MTDDKKSILQRILKNSGILLSGQAFSSILSVISFVLIARSLGPDLFGILVVMQAYVRFIDRLVNFQSWKSLIKYGTSYLDKNQHDKFKALLKLGWLMDLITAIVAVLIAFFAAKMFVHWQGWEEKEWLKYVYIYNIVILVNLIGVPTSILRIFDRFKAFAFQESIIALLKTVGIVWAVLTGAGFKLFFWIWFLSDLCLPLLLILYSLLELKKQKITGILRQSFRLISDEIKEIVMFCFSTNISAAIRIFTREFDVILIGGILGETMAGLFKVAKQVPNVLSKLVDPLFFTVYPELAKLFAAKKYREFSNVITRTSITSTLTGIGFFLLFILFGKWIITTAFGNAYQSVWVPMLLYMFGTVIAVGGIALSPAIYAIGKPNAYLWAILLGTLGYYVYLIAFLNEQKLNAVSIAFIIFYAVYTIVMTLYLEQNLRVIPKK